MRRLQWQVKAAAALGLKVEMCGCAHGVYQSDQALAVVVTTESGAALRTTPAQLTSHIIHPSKQGTTMDGRSLRRVCCHVPRSDSLARSHCPQHQPANCLFRALPLSCYALALQHLPGGWYYGCRCRVSRRRRLLLAHDLKTVYVLTPQPSIIALVLMVVTKAAHLLVDLDEMHHAVLERDVQRDISSWSRYYATGERPIVVIQTAM